MVMPYLQGRTLREVRRSMSAAPTEAWIRSVIEPLLDALEHLHREDVFHRDIAPDNILLPPGELPVLLDFGAARRAIGDRTQLFTAILKPSYAPIEQYADVVQLRQGAWTDLYALGAVVYYLLRGAPPPPATARAVQDDVPLLDARQHPDVSPAFIAAVEWALAIKPGDRPQSVAALREVLEGRASAPPRAAAATPVGEFPPTLIIGRPVTGADPIEPTRPMTRPQPAPAPAPAIAAPAVERTRVVPPARPAAPPEPAARPRRRRSASRIAWLLVSIAGFSALAAGAGWMIGERSGERSNAATRSASSDWKRRSAAMAAALATT